jgi:hypothetical protein
MLRVLVLNRPRTVSGSNEVPAPGPWCLLMRILRFPQTERCPKQLQRSRELVTRRQRRDSSGHRHPVQSPSRSPNHPLFSLWFHDAPDSVYLGFSLGGFVNRPASSL